MDYRYLRVFIEAASTLNFAAASQNLGIATSAVSRQIKLFEESVGQSLFIRSNRKVLLTPVGRELLDRVKLIEDWGGSQRRPLIRVVGLSAALDNYFWPQILRFSDLSKIDLQVQEMNSLQSTALIREGAAELGFVNRKESLGHCSYFQIGKEEHVLISRKKMNLNEIADSAWIYGETGELLSKLTKQDKPKKFIKVSSLSRIYDLVEGGVGVAVVPKSPKLEKRKFCVQELNWSAKPIYLLIPNYELMPPLMKKIFNLLKS